jgi:hypothetical protein
MPDAGSRSGAEIREALTQGQAVSWHFTPDQKRLCFSLPQAFGGRSYEVCVKGGYTFNPVATVSAAA